MILKKINNKIVEATCDICGEDCMIPLYTPKTSKDMIFDSAIKEFEGMELKATWGFSSNNDGEIWNAVLCEKCVYTHLANRVNFLKTPYL